jgi:hypothetical protein
MPLRYSTRDKNYWYWLRDDKSDNQKELGKRLDEIRARIRQLHKECEVNPPLAYFTPHDTRHCETVENTLHDLIPKLSNPEDNKDWSPRESFSDGERFFLLGSAWLHDVGNYRIFEGDDKRKDADIRDEHHIRSERFIVNNWVRCGLREHEAPAFGLLARYHRRREPLSSCPAQIELAEHGTLRIRLLAAYLRLADALHVDVTRSPAESYAIVLAYDISQAQKLHWIRSQFVTGIDVDAENHQLVVHFKQPLGRQSNTTNEHHASMVAKLKHIYAQIIDDLESEVSSVQEVLVDSGISYFLTVKAEYHEVQCSDRLNQDIDRLVEFYDILVHPSSSSLYQLVLETVSGILKSIGDKTRFINQNRRSSLAQSSTPYGDSHVFVLREVKDFLDRVVDQVLVSRQCHAGLANLIDDLQDKLTEGPQSFDSLVSYVEDRKEKWNRDRESVRYYAMMYFKTQVEFLKDPLNASQSDKLVNCTIIGNDADEKETVLCTIQITFNHSALTTSIPSNKQKERLVNNLIPALQQLADTRFGIDTVRISDINVTSGSWIVSFSLVSAGMAAWYTFFTNYEALRKGVTLFIADIRTLYNQLLDIVLRCSEDESGKHTNVGLDKKPKFGFNRQVIRDVLDSKSKEYNDNSLGYDVSNGSLIELPTGYRYSNKFAGPIWNILLYGYSQLVMKAVCGFRDAIAFELLREYSNEKDDAEPVHKLRVHQAKVEDLASRLFRFFVCEAQPKTKTGWGGRIVFHDGERYATELQQRGFRNIFLIPDAIAGSLIASNRAFNGYPRRIDGLDIHYVLVGANGYDDSVFRHSAGHAGIVFLAKHVQQEIIREKESKGMVNKGEIANELPQVILITLSDKKELQKTERKPEEGADKTKKSIPAAKKMKTIEKNSEGWLYITGFTGEPFRSDVFMSQDPKSRDRDELKRHNIAFYNPREDPIRIEGNVDVAITEERIIPNPKNGSDISKKKQDPEK